MADKKISELTALTGANVATDDQLVIVDTSAALTKSITIDEFKNALDTATGFVRITGDTMTGDLSLSGADVTFGDNDKAIFGAGSNLQIYHDGTHNYIEDTSTGNLYIQGTNLILKNQGGTENLADFVSNGAVTLYYDNSPKLATTSTGIDVTGNATFADNGKAIFGAGSDLQIYHDGTRSFIQDVNDGNLILDTFNGNEVNITSGGNAEFMVRAIKDGAVNLYYDNGTYSDPKLATTSTGVNITGVLSSDGLTVDGTTGVTISGAFPMINFGETDTTDENSRVRVSAGDFRIDTVNDAYGSGKTRFLMDNATGDISFYEDTGTSPKFFWDASAESLGIGTDSPSDLLELSGDTAQPAIRLTDADVSGLYHRIFTPTNTGLAISADTGNVAADSFLRFDVDNTEAMRIDSSGNLLVGTTDDNPFNNSAGSADDNGLALKDNGQLQVAAYKDTANSGSVVYFNRTSTDGSIIDFRKDGTTVGSIGVQSSAAYFAGVTYGIKPYSAGIAASNSNGVFANGTADLGKDNIRWKDLYLSGGVFLGGTGSANKLNDYEYGFFEPTFGGTSTNPSGVTYDPTVGNEGYYVKIGKAVFIQINIRTDAISNVGSGNLLIQGLPFAAASVSGQGGVGSFAVSQSTAFSGEAPSAGYVSEGLSYISLFYRTGASAGSIVSECSDLRTIANSNLIRLSGTYYSTE